jgi:hypothetical protein
MEEGLQQDLLLVLGVPVVEAKGLILLALEQPEQADKDSQVVTDLQLVAALMEVEVEVEAPEAQAETHRLFTLVVMAAAA